METRTSLSVLQREVVLAFPNGQVRLVQRENESVSEFEDRVHETRWRRWTEFNELVFQRFQNDERAERRRLGLV